VVAAQWYAIWTHSHCEQLVHDQLTGKGFQVFLPILRTWSRRAGAQRLVGRPMFPGYLFIHQLMEKSCYIEVLKTRGVTRILGERWDQLTAVPEHEIDALQRVVRSQLAVMPYAYLHEGQRVRIDAGPLAGIEGVYVGGRPNQGLLVLSVDLLHRSIAVEVDCTCVTPLNQFSSGSRGIADSFESQPTARFRCKHVAPSDPRHAAALNPGTL
jgi:transcriptional antiterminator NusG